MLVFPLSLLIFYLCFAAGRRGLHVLRLDLGAPEEALISGALGLGLLAYAVLALGILNFLTPAGLWSFLGVLAFFAFFHLREDLTLLRAAAGSWERPRSGSDFAMYGLGALALLAAFAGTLAPETGNDSLCYHLNLPKIYLMEGRIHSIPHDLNSEFPLLMEMLYTFGLGLGKVSLAKFFHFFSGLLAAGMAGAGVLRISGRKESAGWAALFFLTTPVILNQLSTTYVDVGLACFSFFSLMTLILWLENPEQKPKLLILAGIFSGLAMSVKYLALISILIEIIFIVAGTLGPDVIPARFRRGSPTKTFGDDKWYERLLNNLFVFTAAVFVCGGYWYVRSYLITGNPVYPYFASIFKSGNPAIHYDDIGVSKTLGAFLKVFWTLTMKPQIFEGFGVQIGPGYLAFLPLSFLFFKKKSQITWLGVYTVLFLTAWFLLGQSLRFLVPVLPVLAVLIGVGLTGLEKGWAARGLRFLFMLVLGLHAGLAVYHYRRDFRVAVGRESSEHYLRRYERSYGMALYINTHLPADAVILNADETHQFYFKRTMVREVSYAAAERYWEGVAGPVQVIQNLKARGFTHILYAQRRSTCDFAGPVSGHPIRAQEKFRSGWEPCPEPPEKSLSEGSLRVPVLLGNPQNGLASILNPLYTDSFKDEERQITDYVLYQIL